MGYYISRQSAIDIDPPPKHLREYQTGNLDDAYESGWYDAQAEISQIPSADVRPVIRGKWIKEDDRVNHWHCSNCDFVAGQIHRFYKYCPNCSADLRE